MKMHIERKYKCDGDIELTDDIKKIILCGEICLEDDDKCVEENLSVCATSCLGVVVGKEMLKGDEEEDICNYCKKSFKYNYLLRRHYKNCKMYNSELNVLLEKNKLLESENKLLKENMVEMKDNYDDDVEEFKSIIRKKNYMIKHGGGYINNSNNTTNMSTINSYNTNSMTMNINNYKEPSLTHLTNKDYRDCIHAIGKPYFIPLLNAIYFNEDVPENHSLYCGNPRSKSISLYSDKWNQVDANETIDDLTFRIDEILSYHMEKLEDYNDINDKPRNEKMINAYRKDICERPVTDEDKKYLLEEMSRKSKNLNIKPTY
jgi:hypothetical protein